MSHATIAAWSALTGAVPEPCEVAALLHLDAALLEREDAPAKPDPEQPRPVKAWPAKKPQTLGEAP